MLHSLGKRIKGIEPFGATVGAARYNRSRVLLSFADGTV